MQDGNKFDPRSWVLSNLSLIERAWEAQWALRLTQAVLFFDIAMRLTGSPGLVDWNSSTQTITGHLGFILITFAAFTLSMSIVVPITMPILELLLLIPGIKWLFTTDDETSHRPGRPYRCVSISDLENEAGRRNDSALYELAEAESEKRTSQSRAQFGLIVTLTGTLVLTTLNAFPFLISIPGGTILNEMMNYLGYYKAGFVIGILISSMLGIILNTMINQHRQHWVRHPQLHKELEAKRRAELGEGLAFRNRFTEQ